MAPPPPSLTFYVAGLQLRSADEGSTILYTVRGAIHPRLACHVSRASDIVCVVQARLAREQLKECGLGTCRRRSYVHAHAAEERDDAEAGERARERGDAELARREACFGETV